MTELMLSQESFPFIPLEGGIAAMAGPPSDSSNSSDKPHEYHMDPNTQGGMLSHNNGMTVGSGESGTSNGLEGKWIWVLDPMTRKLRVPLRLLVPTQATASSGTVPSLCIAYLEGRCRHPWCRQAHVHPSAIPKLRHEALHAPTCCRRHQDPHDISRLTNKYRWVRITNNGGDSTEIIASDHVASTVGLLRYLVHHAPSSPSTTTNTNTVGPQGSQSQQQQQQQANPSCSLSATDSNAASGLEAGPESDILDLPAKFVCRLHLAHRCRYLEDCNNIHICREYESKLLPPPHVLSALTSVGFLTRTVTIADVQYTVTPLALGDVTDEDFAAMTEAQRLQLQLSSTPTNNNASASLPGSSLSSPMMYAANTMNLSPALFSEGVGDGGAHLRVYDVRAKQGATAGSMSPVGSPASVAVAGHSNANTMPTQGSGGNSTTVPLLSTANNSINKATKVNGGGPVTSRHASCCPPKDCATSMDADGSTISGEATSVADGSYTTSLSHAERQQMAQ